MIRPVLVVALLMAAGAAAATPRPTVETQLQAAIDRIAAEDAKIPGVELTVFSPRMHIDWSGASGRVRIGGDQRLQPDQPFRIASVTKAFTSAAILRLVEQERLALTDPIEGLISADTASLLRSGGYDPGAMQVQHLMTHRSGLVDHTNAPIFTERMTGKGQYHWTRHEQVALGMTLKGPLNAPGATYHYSDTGYVILGEIIERLTGQPLAHATRELLDFRKMGLSTTWYEGQEPEPGAYSPRAHQYFGDGDIDTTDYDPSFDLYGGGGLVSTTKDLAHFFRALLQGEIFTQPRTLAAGLAVPGPRSADPAQPPVPAYAPLMSTLAVGPHTCWGKGGAWGSLALYCPDIDVAIAFTVNRYPSTTPQKVLAEVAKVLDAAAPPATAKGRTSGR